jgi:hypothetical protein
VYPAHPILPSALQHSSMLLCLYTVQLAAIRWFFMITEIGRPDFNHVMNSPADLP